MPKVQFQLTTQGEKQLLNALQKAEKKIESVEGKLKKMKSSGGKSIDGVTAQFQKFAGQLMGSFGVAAAVGAVVKELRAANELMIKNKRLAADVQLTVAQSRANALLNLPSDFKGGSKALDKMVENISGTSGLGREKVYQAMSTGLSARGSVSMTGFQNAMTLASQVEAVTGGQTSAGDLSGSLLDLAKATGMDNAQANLGWLRQAGSASRMTTLEGQLNMVPGISAGKARGVSPERSMEMQAAISQLIVDPSGEKTRTGYVNLTKDLFTEDLLPSSGVDPRTGKKKTTFSPLSGTMDERISQLQTAYANADPEMQRAMEKKIGGRAGMSPFITNMLKNTELYQTTMSASQRQVGAPDASAAAQAQEYFSNVNQGTAGAILQSDIQTKKQVEDIQYADKFGALENQSWEIYEKTLNAQGLNWWERGSRGGVRSAMHLDKLAGKDTSFGETLIGNVKNLQESGRISDEVGTKLLQVLERLETQMDEKRPDALPNIDPLVMLSERLEMRETPNAQDND